MWYDAWRNSHRQIRQGANAEFYCGLLILLTWGFVFQKIYWPSTSFIVAFMIGFYLLYVFINIGLFAIAIQCCWKKISTTQFTLYMTIFNLGRVIGGKLVGTMILSLCCLLICNRMQFIQRDNRRYKIRFHSFNDNKSPPG